MKYSNSNRRIYQTMIGTILLAGFLLFILPMSTMAQILEWSPLSMDFPDVPYGTEETQTLTLTNGDSIGDLIIENVEWTYRDSYTDPDTGDPVPAYEFTTDELLPLGPGGSMGVHISFSPIDDEVMSFVMGELMITNNSTNAPVLYYGVTGMGVVGDTDLDGVRDDIDNCIYTPNGIDGGTCIEGSIGEPCMSDTQCGDGGHCSMFQEDKSPPEGNGIGDACECEGNFNCDDDVDGTDAFDFKVGFGRSVFGNPCLSGNPCNGDFDCDHDSDGSDAFTFKKDFGRSSLSNPCPPCVVGDWCIYPDIRYTIDFLEPGNPGGWTNSLKTFEDAWTLSPGEEIEVDIWVNDLPFPDVHLTFGGFYMEYDPARIDILSVEGYDDDYNISPGPWEDSTIGPVNEETYQVIVFGGVPSVVLPDADGDIIIAKVRLRLNEPLPSIITFRTFGFTVVDEYNTPYDPEIDPKIVDVYVP